MLRGPISCPDGGVMLEAYKDPAWGQVNVRTIPAGASKPGHRHLRTDEWWWLARGDDVWVTVEGVGTFRLPPLSVIEIPAGTGHAVENRGADEAVLAFTRSTLWDPADPDKHPWDGKDKLDRVIDLLECIIADGAWHRYSDDPEAWQD